MTEHDIPSTLSLGGALRQSLSIAMK
jgi:hypothetical protein